MSIEINNNCNFNRKQVSNNTGTNTDSTNNIIFPDSCTLKEE